MRRAFYLISALIWICMVGIGVRSLEKYSATPGQATILPERWPVMSRIKPATGRPTLIMFAHPRCPCTRASMSELARIMAHTQRSINAFVLFYKPHNVPNGWGRSDLIASAASIPGITVLSDIDGNEARQFHALTSGHTILYDAEGNRQFSGGITFGRGHEGDNTGKQAIIDLLTGHKADHPNTPVFGCSLSSIRSR